MTVRRIINVLAAALALLCLTALPVLAAARSPVLWTATAEGFEKRPRSVVLHPMGHEALGRMTAGRGDMRWRSWTASRARGVGTLWINDGIPSYGEGKFHGRRAAVLAWRVRSGHFTRLTVTFCGGNVPWKDGDTRYTWRYQLVRLGGGYSWAR